MILQIYGVKVIDDAKERRYYGDCESLDDASGAVDLVLMQCDYAYAKEVGVGGALIYRENADYHYRAPS
jgi:hypothetical protein